MAVGASCADENRPFTASTPPVCLGGLIGILFTACLSGQNTHSQDATNSNTQATRRPEYAMIA
eukprot:7800690-Alexandrium_andersonii.AAC.1